MKYGIQLFSLRKYLKDEKGYEQVFKRTKETGAQVVQLSGGKPVAPEYIRSLSDKYDLTQHPNYKLTSDYDPKNTFDIEKYLNRKEKINPNDEFVVIDADSLPSA